MEHFWLTKIFNLKVFLFIETDPQVKIKHIKGVLKNTLGSWVKKNSGSMFDAKSEKCLRYFLFILGILGLRRHLHKKLYE